MEYLSRVFTEFFESEQSSRSDEYSGYEGKSDGTICKRFFITNPFLLSQISFNDTRTVGINVLYNDASRGKINARKEVILCAGTVNTVQLLLLSGIGPRKDLDKYQVSFRSLIRRKFLTRMNREIESRIIFLIYSQ